MTPQTIRKDLNILAGRSMLARVHGGAVVTSGTDNLAYAERRSVAAPAKAAIGAAAAALVPNGASLFINIGSTTEAIARALVDHRDLMVITNNLNVVDILGGRPSIEVIAAGGRVRASDRAVVGALAMDFIRGFKVDMALIGASAIDPDGSFLDFDVDEVRVSQTIIARRGRYCWPSTAPSWNAQRPSGSATWGMSTSSSPTRRMPGWRRPHAPPGRSSSKPIAAKCPDWPDMIWSDTGA